MLIAIDEPAPVKSIGQPGDDPLIGDLVGRFRNARLAFRLGAAQEGERAAIR